MVEFESPATSALVAERAALIDSIGVAERVSWGLRLIMAGNIDNQPVHLLLPRKRGLTKEIVYTDLGGAASFRDPTNLVKLLESLPLGASLKQAQYERGGFWVNGYEVEEQEDGRTDARVSGFADPFAQARFEVGLASHVEYTDGIRTEISQELGGEWIKMTEDIRRHEPNLTPAWQEPPQNLAQALILSQYNTVSSHASLHNRYSHRGNRNTHSVSSVCTVNIDDLLLAELIGSGYVQPVLDEDIGITSPFAAVSIGILEAWKSRLSENYEREDVATNLRFYGTTPIKIGTHVLGV